jgi:hypothetical protein
MSSSDGKQCIWDAFGEYSCGRSSTPQAGNAFARRSPRPDWELFTQQPAASSSASIAGFSAASSGAPLIDGNKKAATNKEGFCGCQAAAL